MATRTSLTIESKRETTSKLKPQCKCDEFFLKRILQKKVDCILFKIRNLQQMILILLFELDRMWNFATTKRYILLHHFGKRKTLLEKCEL
jgi:hypothetical protein